MTWIARLKSLCRLLFRRQKVEDEPDAEVRAYFDVVVERSIARGISPEAARRAARLEFEGPERMKEKMRDMRCLVAFSVSQRKREFGIRMAIGPDRRGITRLVLRESLAIAAAGVAVGARSPGWPAARSFRVCS